MSTDAVRAALDAHDAQDAALAAADYATLLAAQQAQAAAEASRDQVIADFEAYRRTHTQPDQVPPPPSDPAAIFSAYAGPMGTQAGQTAASRARVAEAFGVGTLPADRVYSGTGFGKAKDCPSPLVAVSYGQVKALAAGDATVKASLTAELQTLAAKTGQTWHVSCDHEVDSKIRGGTYTGAQVKAAHAAFAQIVRAVGAPNIKVAGCWTGYVFTLPATDPSNPSHYYDPASYDVVAVDAYYVTQRTAAIAFDPAWGWMKTLGKPLAIWETGWSTDSNPQNPTDSVVATKVQEIVDYWKPKVGYVLFFESTKGDNLLEERPAALAEWAAEVQRSSS